MKASVRLQPYTHPDLKIHPKVRVLTPKLIGAPYWSSFWCLRKISTLEHMCKLSTARCFKLPVKGRGGCLSSSLFG